VETKAIQQFVTALESRNLNELRTSTSPNFQQKALRLTEALDDFQILNLPDGEVSVVKVEDVVVENGGSPTHKRVTVEMGQRKRKLLYSLVRNPKTDDWVVDDVYVRQRRKGLTATKSVTEQMDLLLTVREFLAAWTDGAREDVLAVTAPELRELLNKLPPTYLARLTTRIVGSAKRAQQGRPEAQLDEDVAVVRLPRPSGSLMLSMKLLDGQWKIRDAAVEAPSEEDTVPSVRKLAAAAGATARVDRVTDARAIAG